MGKRQYWWLRYLGCRNRPCSAGLPAIAEEDGTLDPVGSTWSAENDAVYDGVARPGVRLVTFAPVLKHHVFPLAPILVRLLEIGAAGTSSAVEVEFAVSLSPDLRATHEFAFLQLRPLALSIDGGDLDQDTVPDQDLVCRSTAVLGNGRIDDLYDVVVVDYRQFERCRSQEVAREVGLANARLAREGRRYILIGAGRWGSKEPLLGVPVTWNQISGARVIVEAGFKDFTVTPSQGAHFFQNIAAAGLGYFTVNPERGEGLLDWNWLAQPPATSESALVRCLRFDQPLVVKMHGRSNTGIILKPGTSR